MNKVRKSDKKLQKSDKSDKQSETNSNKNVKQGLRRTTRDKK